MSTSKPSNFTSKHSTSTATSIVRIALAVAFVTTIGAKASFSAPSDLDTTFGGTGKVTTDFNRFDAATSIVRQTDGKIVCSGISNQGTSTLTPYATLCRYNTNGILDTTYGTSGKVTVSFAGANPGTITSSAIQSDGKVVVAGYYRNSPATTNIGVVLRFNVNGTLDTTFGSSGKAIVDGWFGNECRVNAIQVQADGRIVVAGNVKRVGASYPYLETFVYRLYSDGSKDVSSLYASGAADAGDQVANCLAIQSDGGIVVGGYVVRTTNNTSDFFVIRLLGDAYMSPDSSFTLNNTDFYNKDDVCTDIAVQSDGKIVAVGRATVQATTSPNIFYPTIACVRYNSNGSLDSSFGGTFGTPRVGGAPSAGKAIADFGRSSRGNSVAFASSGRILVGGALVGGSLLSPDEAGDNFGLAMFVSNGGLDSGFDSDGLANTDFGRSDQCRSLLIQPDGKIVATGDSTDGTGNNDFFATARYTGYPTGMLASPASSASTSPSGSSS